MPTFPRGHSALACALLLFAGCSELGRRLDGSLAVVEVIETPPPIAIDPTPSQPPPPSLLVLGDPAVAPELVFAEPLPPPAKHVVTISTLPAGETKLNLVQSLEVDVEITGGPVGTRHVNAVFISPQGVVWERKLELLDAVKGQPLRATFSLPIASTFIEDQQLSGTWQVLTLDEGVEQASASFLVEGVSP